MRLKRFVTPQSALAAMMVCAALATARWPAARAARVRQSGSVPRNVRVSQGPFEDYAEPALAVNPRDARDLLGASQCFNGPALPRPCTFVSVDGGRTWHDNGPLPLPAGDRGGGDVSVAFDPHGHGFVAAHAGAGWTVDTVLVWRTDDGGHTFRRPIVVFAGHRSATVVDHPSLAVDTTGGLDLAWTATPHGSWRQTRLLFSHSADGGRHFTRPRPLVSVAHGFPGLPVVTVGPAGRVYVFFATGHRDPYARPFAPMERLVVSSDDAGASFGPPQPIAAAPGFGIVVAGQSMANIQAAATDPRDGTLYLALVAFRPPRRRTTILLWRSRTGGATWRGPVRIDGESGAEGADHTQPQLAVTPQGTLYGSYFAWVHGRVTLYLAVSHTHGSAFGMVGQITSHSFDPTLSDQQRAGTPWIGDYQGLAVGDKRLYPIWNDTRTGHLQIFAAAVPTR